MKSSPHNVSNELKDDQLTLFRSQGGSVWPEVKLGKEILRLTQKQAAYLFKPERGVITNHRRSIFSTGKLDEESACAKYAHAAGGLQSLQGQVLQLHEEGGVCLPGVEMMKKEMFV